MGQEAGKRGKGMSGGYAPLAAILFKGSIQEAFLGEAGERREFHRGHTCGGNPVACAAGIAAVKQLVERRLVENARRMGERLRRRLEAMNEKYPLIGDVRGRGSSRGSSS